MKPVKILKRPSATPPPQTPLERTTNDLSALLEAALQRERARLEAVYRTRQETLLRVVSNILNDTMERVVVAAARREMDALSTSFANLPSSPQPPTTDPTATAAAFTAAFDSSLLPSFEAALSAMLTKLSTHVDQLVDQTLLTPATSVVTAVEGAADSVRAVHTELNDSANLLRHSITNNLLADSSTPDAESDAVDAAAVQRALDEGNVRDALVLATGKSVLVQAKAVSGVLDLSVGPEEAFGGNVPPIADLIMFAAVLSMDLQDRTEARLAWLYEVVALMDDAEELGESKEEVDASKRRLEGTVDRLLEFQKTGKPGPTEMKHTKLLVRVLKAHLNQLEG